MGGAVTAWITVAEPPVQQSSGSLAHTVSQIANLFLSISISGVAPGSQIALGFIFDASFPSPSPPCQPPQLVHWDSWMSPIYPLLTFMALPWSNPVLSHLVSSWPPPGPLASHLFL